MWGHNDTPQYWLYGRTYYFAAVAPSNSQNITSFAPTVYNKDNDFTNTDGDKIIGTLSYNNSGTEDLIYSTYIHKALASGNGPVELKFQHLLSKVYLSFENEVDPYINVVISNVKVQALKSSTYYLDTNKWDIAAEENNEFSNSSVFSEYSFPTLYETNTETDEDVAIETIEPSHEGHTNSCFFIPANKYKITFDVTFKMEGVNEVLYTGSKTAILDDALLQKGAAYKFKTTITPKIVDANITTFEIENIQNWNQFSVDSQISIASKLGGILTLTSDVNFSKQVDVASDLTINLNGNKITYDGTNCLFNVINSATLTINGNDNGNSSMISTDVGLIAAANSGTHIVINGGNHTTAGNTTYQSAGGTINVLGGKFNAEPITQEGDDVTSTYKTLDIESATGGKIVISKGSFYQWDPANSANGDLLDKSIAKLKSLLDMNKQYYVVDQLRTETISGGTDAEKVEDFKNYLSNPHIDTVKLETPIDNGNIGLAIRRDVVIDGKGKTYIGGANGTAWYNFEIYGPYNVIIKNVNMIGGGVFGYQQKVDGVYQGLGPNLVIENCSITTKWATTGRNAITLYNGTVVVKNTDITISTASTTSSGLKANYMGLVNSTGIVIKDANVNYTPKEVIFSKAASDKPGFDGDNLFITGGTFDKDPTNWVPKTGEYTITKTVSNWIVTGPIYPMGYTGPFAPEYDE